MNQIVRIKKATKLLVDAFYKLDSLYSFQLLIILSELTLNTLFGLYFSIFGAGFSKHSSKTSLNFQKISNLANDVIWSFYYFIRFVFICIVTGLLTKTVIKYANSQINHKSMTIFIFVYYYYWN